MARRYAPADSRDELLELLREGADSEVRGKIFELPEFPRADPQPLLRHQAEAIQRIEHNSWTSGILHLPTGSGKTRIGLELMALRLDQDARTRIIWATHTKTVLRQSMIRVTELAERFGRELAFAWPRARQTADPELFDKVDIVFVTRDSLTKWLDCASDGRRKTDPLRVALTAPMRSGGHDILLVYDECHELGAAKLQRAWRAFHERLVQRHRAAKDRFRVFGLSATPMPTATGRHALLREVVFPLLAGAKTTQDWGVLVHSSESMRSLEARKILCPISLGIQKSRRFDIPDAVLRRAAADSETKAPRRGDMSERQWAQEFSSRFNRGVMSHPDVLGFLADRIGDNLPVMGKTIVFCPTIQAANALVARLKDQPGVGPGKVTLVHSRMEDQEVAELEKDIDPEADARAVRKDAQIRAFVDRGSEPCVMVNVGMLTTGFDDPKIRTVLLARLTFSRNLFWQMIGRGLRGPVAGGTVDCNVIDPIRLIDKFDVFNGYRPDLAAGGFPAHDFEQHDGQLVDAQDLAPVVEEHLPPPPPDLEMVEIRKAVREALRAFLAGAPFDAGEIADALDEVTLEYGADGHVLRPADEQSSPATKLALLETRVRTVSEKIGADITSWFFAELVPQALDKLALNVCLRKLQVVEAKAITTLDAWRRHELEVFN